MKSWNIKEHKPRNGGSDGGRRARPDCGPWNFVQGKRERLKAKSFKENHSKTDEIARALKYYGVGLG